MSKHTARRTHLLIALLLAGFVLALFARLLFTNRVLATGDILLYFYPYRAYAASVLRSGHIPFWNPYIFTGAPFLANPQAAVLYPLHWPLLWLDVTKQIAWSAALHAWLLAFGGYLLMRRLGAGALAGLVAGIVLAGSGFYGGLIGHINQMNGAAWLPWALLLVTPPAQGASRRGTRLLIDGGLLGLVVALMLLAGHTQTAYINLFGVGVWVLLLALEPAWAARHTMRRAGLRAALGRVHLEPLAVYVLGVLLGALLYGPQLLPTLEISNLGLRSGGLSFRDATSFSLPPATLHWSLLPSYGLVNLEARFGTPAWSEFVAYLGMLALALALLGGGVGRGRARRAGLLFVILGLGLALGRWNPAWFVLHAVVPGFDLFRTPARWLMLYTLGGALLAGLGAEWLIAYMHTQRPRQARLGPAAGVALPAFIAAELLIAALALPHTHPTAPAAVYDLRSAPAHLRTDPGALLRPAAAGRFLGMSTITYDPGDEADFARVLRDTQPPQLGAHAFDDLVIALKVQELLVPNLPLFWQIPAVDGYDGGVLPLLRYNQLVSLLAPPDTLIPDGRLREQIADVPSAALLGLLDAQYIVTDKTRDLWFDNVFYDRQIGLRLTSATPQGLIEVPTPFAATHVDLIAAVEGDVVPGTPVASVALRAAAPMTATARFTLTAAAEPGALTAQTGTGVIESQLAYTDGSTGQQAFRLRLPLASPAAMQEISINLIGNAGALELQAATLFDARTGMFQALLPSDRGRFRLVHSGDVKVYENLDRRPRAWLAQAAMPVADADAALALLRAGAVDPLVTPLVEGAPTLPHDAPPDAQAGSATLLSYAPERVEIATTSNAPALLVLSDAYYPGWQATVDGAPAPILPTNILFRGVEVPAGDHVVTFTFAPTSWRNGLLVGAAGLLLWLVVMATGVRLRRPREHERR